MEKHITWLEDKEKKLEKKVLAEYSLDEIQKHLTYLITLTRIAGTEDELKAAKYIKDKLEEYNIDCEIYEFDAYISHPGKAELEILSPLQKSFPCLSNAFIASSSPMGIEAELMWVGKGTEEDYRGKEARGKIVLVKSGGGMSQVAAARIADEKGALAQVHINSGKQRAINFMQLRDTWGSPTPETLDRIPKTPAVNICNEDGQYLSELTQKDHVLARMKAEAWRGYRKIRFPVGTIKGMREPEKYVLLGAHYCSWYIGATDNAVANSLMLEMARIFSKHRKSLGKGIRFAWWAGHSQGSFAGSTWYADNFWDDIRDNAVAYLVMDGLGRAGASEFDPRNTEEIRNFCERIVKEMLGVEVKSKRPPRSGDQSYWGMGLPSATVEGIFPAGSQEGEKVWYSHTSEDTLDKVDMELISVPFKVNTVSTLRLCNNPVLPFEFVTVAGLFKKGLNDLQKGSQSILDLTSLLTQAEALEKKTEALNRGIKKVLLAYEKKGADKKLENKFKEINTCLMELSRILLPVLATKAGKYGQDPMGTKYKPIPVLQSLEKMASMDSESEEFKALRTSLLRERNKVSDALHAANQVLERTLNRI